MDPRLASLLLNLDDLSDEEAEQFVFEKYVELYLDRGEAPGRIGVRKAHDGADVKFGESRFEHAFCTHSETSRQYRKDEFVRTRGARVAWIGPVVAGEVEGIECWLIPPKNGKRDVRNRPRNRLYVVRSEAYVVWLEPTRDGGWWFSTAYVTSFQRLRSYCCGGMLLWAHKKPRD